MAIIDTLDEFSFRDGFNKMDSTRGVFSYEGLTALYHYLDELSESGNIEYDPVAICCDFAEYKTYKDLLDDYDDTYTLEDLKEHIIHEEGNSIIINKNF